MSQLLLLGLIVLWVVHGASAGPPDWHEEVERATWVVNDECTGHAVSGNLIVTASHCVGRVGVAVTLTHVRPPHGTRGGVVIADDPHVDLALVRPWLPVTTGYWSAPCRPVAGEVVVAWTFSMGLVGWTSRLTYVGEYVELPRRRHVRVIRGDLYPGSSGAVVWALTGCPVLVVTQGVATAAPPIVWGPRAEYVDQMLAARR